MAINKSQTPTWVKVVIIVVVVAFVGSVPIAALVQGAQSSGQGSAGQFDQTQQQPGTVDSINAKYAAGAQTLQAAVASDPASYTALVNLGNNYLDWGGELLMASQTSTPAAAAYPPLFAGAKDAYARALKVNSDDPAVRGDYAIALFYTGDTPGAIKEAEAVVKAKPDFAVVWFNLGNFYSATDKAKAIAAYKKYLELEPTGDRAQAAKDNLKSLESGQ